VPSTVLQIKTDFSFLELVTYLATRLVEEIYRYFASNDEIYPQEHSPDEIGRDIAGWIGGVGLSAAFAT
jgi:hypothetical protein